MIRLIAQNTTNSDQNSALGGSTFVIISFYKYHRGALFAYDDACRHNLFFFHFSFVSIEEPATQTKLHTHHLQLLQRTHSLNNTWESCGVEETLVAI